MSFSHEQSILNSWCKNAQPWIAAVQHKQIMSRQLVTDAAIVHTILRQFSLTSIATPTLLDMGCGEGWLARVLSQHGIQVYGIDGVPALIEQARKQGGGHFEVLPYEQVEDGCFPDIFDAIACNFSLFGDQSVTNLLARMPSLLKSDGKVVIQTLHPVTACGEFPYQSGWRTGSWAGFNPDFTDPAPWYFRTIETWRQNFREARLLITDCIEPQFPESKQLASIIFVLRPGRV